MAKRNLYFPCDILEQENAYSVVCSHFHYFDDYFGDQGGGGYSVERLAKKLVREHGIKGVKFDSEAGLFCAYSDKKGPLKTLCTQLRKITGGESKHAVADEPSGPTFPLTKAERLLVKGFVTSLDKRAQAEFLRHVPCPNLSKQQSECMRLVRDGTETDRINAARKINSEARTLVRDWSHYLSHPSTTKTLLDCCDTNRDVPDVYQELIWALVFICQRHLPDLRAQPYFLSALEDKRLWMRCLGLMGLYNLCVLTPDLVKPLLKDKSSKVRDTAKDHMGWLESSAMQFPSWMFETEIVVE